MDTLPQSTQTQPSQVSQPAQPIGSVAKEIAPIAHAETTPAVSDGDHESVLSPEVAHAGIRMRSDTVTIPKNVAQLGVKVVNQPPPSAAQTPSIVLPLNDEQIAQGLHQSITSSFRWLAEWCERRLKEIHFVVRSISGKAVREKI